MSRVFVSGASGYLGRALIPQLLRRNREVCALVRAGSEGKLPPGCSVAVGNALQESAYARHLRPHDTLVHLVGVSHPSPWKGDSFERVDVGSVAAAAGAAVEAGVDHFVYVSVAHPAPVMRAYIAARTRCEEIIRGSGLKATILRPWYILGPGHRWPYVLLPVYWLLERVPGTRGGALRLGLVTHPQMIRALVNAVEQPAAGIRIVDAPQIRSA